MLHPVSRRGHRAGRLLDRFEDVFAGADTRLFAVTGGLVSRLLIAIYRSPILWLIPFFTVILTEAATRGLAALLGEAGLVINGENAGILSVLASAPPRTTRCRWWRDTVRS